MPVWSIAAPANDTVLLWQVSQAAVVDDVRRRLALRGRAVVAGRAARRRCRCGRIRPRRTTTVLLWQVSQAAVVTMCVAGLPFAVVPLWQRRAVRDVCRCGPIRPPANDDGALVAGLAGGRRDDVRRRLALRGRAVVAAGAVRDVMPVWSMRPPANDAVLLWQVSQAAVVTMCVAGLPLAVVPLWQVAQPDVMPVWSIRRAGERRRALVAGLAGRRRRRYASRTCPWPSCRCGSPRSPTTMPV